MIAAAWSQHHHVLRYAERTDARLRTLNMVWLLTIVLNPFATRLLTLDATWRGAGVILGQISRRRARMRNAAPSS